MQIGVGYELIYDLPQSTPMLLTLHVHHSRTSDLVAPDYLVTVPAMPVTGYRDLFGNWISRIFAPAGELGLSGHAVVNDPGCPTRSAAMRFSTRSRTCRKKPYCSCLGQPVLPGDPRERWLHADGRLRRGEWRHVDQQGLLC